LLEWKEEDILSKGILLIVVATIQSNELRPSCGGAVGIEVSRVYFGGIDSDLTTVKECLGARVKVLGVEAA